MFDREELFIGSINFDPRSDHYNTEMGLIVHSPRLAREAWRLVQLAELRAAHRLHLNAADEVEWLSPPALRTRCTPASQKRVPDAQVARPIEPFAPESLL